jgi:3-methyl-2-oxobutanoate hydroxymethyltransferase
MADAIEGYVGAVERGEFPADEHSHYEDGIEDVY